MDNFPNHVPPLFRTLLANSYLNIVHLNWQQYLSYIKEHENEFSSEERAYARSNPTGPSPTNAVYKGGWYDGFNTVHVVDINAIPDPTTRWAQSHEFAHVAIQRLVASEKGVLARLKQFSDLPRVMKAYDTDYNSNFRTLSRADRYALGEFDIYDRERKPQLEGTANETVSNQIRARSETFNQAINIVSLSKDDEVQQQPEIQAFKNTFPTLIRVAKDFVGNIEDAISKMPPASSSEAIVAAARQRAYQTLEAPEPPNIPQARAGLQPASPPSRPAPPPSPPSIPAPPPHRASRPSAAAPGPPPAMPPSPAGPPHYPRPYPTPPGHTPPPYNGSRGYPPDTRVPDGEPPLPRRWHYGPAQRLPASPVTRGYGPPVFGPFGIIGAALGAIFNPSHHPFFISPAGLPNVAGRPIPYNPDSLDPSMAPFNGLSLSPVRGPGAMHFTPLGPMPVSSVAPYRGSEPVHSRSVGSPPRDVYIDPGVINGLPDVRLLPLAAFGPTENHEAPPRHDLPGKARTHRQSSALLKNNHARAVTGEGEDSHQNHKMSDGRKVVENAALKQRWANNNLNPAT